MSSPKTFVDSCLAGAAFLDEIDDYVDQWHDNAELHSSMTLAQHLGMTSAEYRLWVERPESLRFILAAHRDRVEVGTLLRDPRRFAAAARTEQHGEAAQLLTWLQSTGRLSDPIA
ncbi:hypothetical protein GCM10010123_18170 [Pilimelia anulata]|uniref:Uncharacterized protein n=1 Tax=Pilimelia anulata TaxID=53371 RepID=A0A8J3F8Q2_9ACTN|nr:hypothetical protein [Pilimelia anulata]GGJ88958.1 hypothetical protein GCM10010123_18170 [Pilimelia anulata]